MKSASRGASSRERQRFLRCDSDWRRYGLRAPSIPRGTGFAGGPRTACLLRHAAKMVLNFGPVVCSGLHVSPGFPNRTLAFRLTEKLPDIHQRMPEKPKVRILLAPPGSPRVVA